MASSASDPSGVVLRAPGLRAGGAPAPPRVGRSRRQALAALSAAALLGVGGAALVAGRGGGGAPAPAVAPAPEPSACATLERELAEARAALAAETRVADELRAGKAAIAAQAAAATAVQAQLADVVGGQGQVTQRGDEITLELVDKVLFPIGAAELTPRGQAVLARVGAALNDVPDKQIWVQGHTDDTPIRPSAGAPPRFASNWELSSARALTVVHYLQAEAKVDPRRLAAVAFGEHRPAARAKAKNRRIEIVLYPNHQLAR